MRGTKIFAGSPISSSKLIAAAIRTRVAGRRATICSATAMSAFGIVKLMSVVPSSYWAPESTRNNSPGESRRLLFSVTR